MYKIFLSKFLISRSEFQLLLIKLQLMIDFNFSRHWQLISVGYYISLKRGKKTNGYRMWAVKFNHICWHIILASPPTRGNCLTNSLLFSRKEYEVYCHLPTGSSEIVGESFRVSTVTTKILKKLSSGSNLYLGCMSVIILIEGDHKIFAINKKSRIRIRERKRDGSV